MASKPLDIEYKVGSKKELISETDMKGVITYANGDFVELSGYSEDELKGSPHSILRDIEMPQTVFKLLWESLKSGHDYKAIVRNRRKDGKYYWVYSEYEAILDESYRMKGFRSKRYPVPKAVLKEVEDLYIKLLSIEEAKGQKDAEKFLELTLHNDGYRDYDLYVEELYNRKIKGFFGMFGSLFSK